MKKNYVTIITLALIVGMNAGVLAQTTKDVPKNAEPIKFIEIIAGTWKLKSVVDMKSPTAKKTNDDVSNAYQIIEFGPNARYKTNTGAQSVEEGSYRLNEQQGTLYLESDSDDVTPSEWDISFKEDLMTMAPKGNKDVKRYKYVFTKTSEGISTSN